MEIGGADLLFHEDRFLTSQDSLVHFLLMWCKTESFFIRAVKIKEKRIQKSKK